MNSILKSSVMLATAWVMVIALAVSPAYAQLTTGDIAQFTDQQSYTYERIKHQVLLLSLDENVTEIALTDEEMSKSIMAYFIENGYTYCYQTSEFGEITGCVDSADMTRMDNIIKDKYIEIAQQNPKNLLAQIANFFGW